MRIEQWLGKDNQLGIDIWTKKYQFENESFDEWLDRVSNGNEKIKQLIIEKKFLFAGRILANRGLDKKGKHITYSNCYVIPAPEDNIEDIYRTCSDLARTFSYSGGCGIDISKLRPAGMKVNNAADTTTGAVSFMSTFNEVAETIGARGRRAAMMISIDCKHPDLEEFISIKNDLAKVTKANISVRVSDEFMIAVINDKDWELYFKTEHGDEMRKIVKAREIFRVLSKNNADFAEPGILFWDNIRKYNLLSEDNNFEYAGVNPCLVGDTLIDTSEGQIKIKDLVGKTPVVSCMNDDGDLIWGKAIKVWKTRENAELVKIQYEQDELICTPDHLIFTVNRGWVKAEELKLNDKVNYLNNNNLISQLVVNVEHLDYKEDVYDMTVEEHHNFIANGIIVHNCAEEPLPAGGSCLLGSVNLSEYVVDGRFMFEQFAHDLYHIVVGMNEVLDQGLILHPLQVQKESVRDWRQIGVGIMGLADMLIKMELKYDSEEAKEFCDKVGFVMANECIKASAHLASLSGTYPMYNKEAIKHSDFFKYNTTGETKTLVDAYGLRNSQILTVAPCGTLSTMLGVSGGIEPIFSLSYSRKTQSLHGEDVYYEVFTPIADEYMKKHKLSKLEELPDYFVTAQNIDPFKRVEMQGIWQKHIDASISSTVNLVNETTVEEVEELYIHAWKNGLKGMTIYRDGCARGAVLSTKKKEKKQEEVVEEKVNELSRGVIAPTKDNVIGLKRKIQGGCGSLHIQAYFDIETGDMTEVFINKGSQGGCNSNLNALSRMISLSLRGGINVKDIADQLNSTINCPSFASARAKGISLSPGSSCAGAVGKVLIELEKEFKSIFDKTKQKKPEMINAPEEKIVNKAVEHFEPTKQYDDELCPDCKSKLTRTGGCNVCSNCGWSKCN